MCLDSGRLALAAVSLDVLGRQDKVVPGEKEEKDEGGREAIRREGRRTKGRTDGRTCLQLQGASNDVDVDGKSATTESGWLCEAVELVRVV